MQIVDAFCNVKCELLAIVPRHLDLHVVQETPERSPRTILEHDAQVGLPCAGTKEEHYVGVADDFHDCALVFEFFKFVLFDNLAFDLLDSHNSVFPTTAVHDTVATFRKLAIVAKLSERDFIVLDEGSGLVRDKGTSAPILLVLDESLFEFTLEVLWISASLLQLLKDLALVG